MKNIDLLHEASLPVRHSLNKSLDDEKYQQTIIDYYSEAGLDYEPWSSRFNMHFGYYRVGLNPFNRESLLDEMNRQVCLRLNIEKGEQTLIDLGCGVGATARYCAEYNKESEIHGITIVPWQIQKGKALGNSLNAASRISYHLADYRHTPFAENSFSGAYAIESSCYDRGEDKLSLLKEAYRVLKPGAKFVIADGFRKTKKGNRFFEFAHRQVCKGWSLDTFADIDDFVAAMKKVGFKNIVLEDISWRLAPSVMHVPWVSLKYFFTHILPSRGKKPFQKLHLIAPVMGLIMGLHRQSYGYYLLSAEK